MPENLVESEVQMERVAHPFANFSQVESCHLQTLPVLRNKAVLSLFGIQPDRLSALLGCHTDTIVQQTQAWPCLYELLLAVYLRPHLKDEVKLNRSNKSLSGLGRVASQPSLHQSIYVGEDTFCEHPD